MFENVKYDYAECERNFRAAVLKALGFRLQGLEYQATVWAKAADGWHTRMCRAARGSKCPS